MSNSDPYPYQMRMELLHLAFNILNDHRTTAKGPGSPTTEQIIAEAEKLNKFVSQK